MEKHLERIDQIIQMKHNWTLDKEEGIAPPTHEAIEETKRILPIMMKYETKNRFYIYPSMEGGTLIEWNKDNWGASVEVLPDGKSYEFLSVNVENRDCIDDDNLNLVGDFETDFQNFIGKF